MWYLMMSYNGMYWSENTCILELWEPRSRTGQGTPLYRQRMILSPTTNMLGFR